MDDPFPEEVRITDPDTGGAKGQKPVQYSTLCWQALDELAKVGSFGSRKYAKFNYLLGYKWSLSHDAAMRHLSQWAQGKDRDEDGLMHAACAAWHCLTLVSFTLLSLGTDDRWRRPK